MLFFIFKHVISGPWDMQKRQEGKVTRKQRCWLSAFWGKKINTHQRLKFNILFKQRYSSTRQKYCVLKSRQNRFWRSTNQHVPADKQLFYMKGVKNGTQLPFNAVKATKQNKKCTRRLQCYENKFSYIFSSFACLLPFVRNNAAEKCALWCVAFKY